MERARQSGASCSHPPALSNVALLAVIDNEADTDVINHLDSCAFCSERAASFAELQQFLRAQLYRLFCPSSDLLIDYQQGLLRGEQRSAIAQHLSTCPHCAREVALVEQMVELL